MSPLDDLIEPRPLDVEAELDRMFLVAGIVQMPFGGAPLGLPEGEES